MKKYFNLHISNLLVSIITLHSVAADTIDTNINFHEWQKRIIFSPQKKACPTCNFTISYPLQDTQYKELFATNNPNIDIALQQQNNSKDTATLMQNNVLHNLFDSPAESHEDSLYYEFLGQRQQEFVQNDVLSNFQNHNFHTIPTNLIKAIFMKTDIPSAYQQILRHKGIFSCIYCNNLDKISQNLPKKKTEITHNTVKYVYTPRVTSYMIEISDTLCGTVDNLVFMQDKDSVELWVYSRFECNNSANIH